jgi:hypothetical protein
MKIEMQVLYMLGDITAGPAFRFSQWLDLVRKRSARYRTSGFPRLHSMPSPSFRFLCIFIFLYCFFFFFFLSYFLSIAQVLGFLGNVTDIK